MIAGMKIVALAGGVGGAKLVDGLSHVLPDESLTVVVNTGDDFDHLGLRICPDLDTICYTLAGIANPETGWGRADETWNAFDNLGILGGSTWFRLGDKDLGTHLKRTELLKIGHTLSEVTDMFCKAWGVATSVLPMTDDHVETVVRTHQGDLPFQDYFVRLGCQPQVSGFHFQGLDSAKPSPGVLASLSAADLIVICPSNPWVSIDPILALPGIRTAITGGQTGRHILAVSPIIAGQAVKGPAAKMYREMGINPSALSVAQHYGARDKGGLLTGFVFDQLDSELADDIAGLGLKVFSNNTIMKSVEDRRHLASNVVSFFSKGLQVQ
jgi:LPPG:FO 2-phospho-L-lactate transferase